MRFFTVFFILLLPQLSHAVDVVDLSQLSLVAESENSISQIVDLGQDVRRGVEARAQLEAQPLIDLNEPLAGDLRHFLLSVNFIEKSTEKNLLEGQVAARTFTSDNQAVATIRLESQQASWTGIMVLPFNGETMIKIGSKLGDNKKRIYRFFYNNLSILPLIEESKLLDEESILLRQISPQ